MKSLVLVRHAESLHNAGLDDDIDTSLTDEGLLQAQKVARKIRELVPDIREYTGFVSPFFRCLRTAVIIWRFIDIPIKVFPALHETPVYFPSEGYKLKSHEREFPNFDWEWNREYFTSGYYHLPSDLDIVKRMGNVLGELPEKSFVISHGTPIQIMGMLELGIKMKAIPVWDGVIKNCSLTQIVDNRVRYWGVR